MHLAKETITNVSFTNTDPPIAVDQGSMAEEVLNAHNQYRAAVGVPPLTWSDSLASHAQEWADYLASLGGLQHSQDTGEGENLWMSSSGNYSYAQMIESWGSEQQYFIGGVSPDFSSTGQFQDVGHYTQIVWRETTEVGCAVASANSNDFLVCRYNPPGNVPGQVAF